MILLGLDMGAVRIGVAKSDPTGTIAQPYDVIDARNQALALEKIGAIVKTESVDKIIVGMPRNMDGTYGEAAAGVSKWMDLLKANIAVPIETWDERLSTKSAERAMLEGDLSRAKRKQKIDKLAAQIILQSYLDSHQKRNDYTD